MAPGCSLDEMLAVRPALTLLIAEYDEAVDHQHSLGHEGVASKIYRESKPARSALDKVTTFIADTKRAQRRR